ncbi:MAG TPA: hypothetical protein VKE22_22630 [Haliangiales bacterium]|nr:hypothetical protein [Haliangiales bacterium]
MSLPARVQGTLTTASCAVATTGPMITLTGELALGGMSANVVFRNNQKGTHEHIDEVAASTVLIPASATIVIPESTTGGMILNPVISVQLIDEAGNPVSAEIALGPCAGGTFPVSATIAIDTIVTLTVNVAGCANHPGPTITISGSVRFAGLRARLIVRDGAGGPIVGTATTDASIVVLAAGHTLSIPKQPVRGGVGGNPWISLQLLDGAGKSLTDEILVGRCVQLSGEGD